MLKKFTDFTIERNNDTNKIVGSKVVPEPEKKQVIKEPVVKEPNNPKEPKVSDKKFKETKEPTMEKFELIGKIAKFSNKIKPSISIVLLEKNNVSKEKLHYIISEQTNDTLVVIRYNEKAEIKLTEFITTLMNYYKRNEQLKESFNKIIVEGTENYSIIKNIPNILFGERKLIQVLNNDLVKLLK